MPVDEGREVVVRGAERPHRASDRERTGGDGTGIDCVRMTRRVARDARGQEGVEVLEAGEAKREGRVRIAVRLR